MGKKKPEEKPRNRVERFTQNLRVTLSPAEVADRADRAAQLIADKDAKEEELKAAAKHAKAVLDSMQGQIRQLSNEVRTKASYRDVECERIYDLSTCQIREIRTDTGETTFERPMTDAERQGELDYGKPGDDLEDDFGDAAES